MAAPLISFLSDYGRGDEFVGVCHGVIARRCPQARIIDLAHEIPRHDVNAGALVLHAALRYLPAGVHLAVVDPGVGAPRRALALAPSAAGQLLVGPDNGLLWLAAEELGGVREAVDIGDSPERLQPVSATFHGRDLFAPVAAALACGGTLRDVGEPVDTETLVRLELPRAYALDGALHAHVLAADRFGNLTLDARVEQLAELGWVPGSTLQIRARDGGPEDTASASLGRTFADVPTGELVLHEDSRGLLALAANRASASERLRIRTGEELEIRAR